MGGVSRREALIFAGTVGAAVALGSSLGRGAARSIDGDEPKKMNNKKPDKLQVVKSHRLASLSRADVEELLKSCPEWPEKLMKPLRDLPLHLQSQTRRIATDSRNPNWQSTGMDFPDGTVFQIYDPSGSATYNDGSNYTNAYGEDISNGSVQQAPSGSGFRVWTVNKWGFFFSTPSAVYIEPRNGYGSGVMKDKSRVWIVKSGQGGPTSTIYNDDYYDDNGGVISATIEWWPATSFFRWIAPH